MGRLFPLVAAIILVDSVFYAAITPLLPDYSDDLGLSKSAAGLLSASYAAGTLVAALPAGWLASRAGGRTTTIVGLALLGVTSVAFGFAEDIVVLGRRAIPPGRGRRVLLGGLPQLADVGIAAASGAARSSARCWARPWWASCSGPRWARPPPRWAPRPCSPARRCWPAG